MPSPRRRRGRPRAPRRWPGPRRWGPRRSAGRSRGRSTRSVKVATSSTSCSTSRMAKPCSACTVRSVAASAAVSWRSRPDDGSSSRRSLGSVISARPTSTRRPWPEAEPLDGLVGQVAEAEQVEHLVAARPARRAWRRPRPRRSRHRPAVAAPGALGDEEVLADGRLREQLDALEGAADAPPGPLVHGEGADVLAPEAHRAPLSGLSRPSMQLKSVVLPAPLGPMSPTRSPSSHLEGHAVEGHDPGEATW